MRVSASRAATTRDEPTQSPSSPTDRAGFPVAHPGTQLRHSEHRGSARACRDPTLLRQYKSGDGNMLAPTRIVMWSRVIAALACPGASLLNAQTPSAEKAFIAMLEQSLQTRDTARLASLIDPTFHIGPISGAYARGMMMKLTVSSATPTA